MAPRRRMLLVRGMPPRSEALSSRLHPDSEPPQEAVLRTEAQRVSPQAASSWAGAGGGDAGASWRQPKEAGSSAKGRHRWRRSSTKRCTAGIMPLTKLAMPWRTANLRGAASGRGQW